MSPLTHIRAFTPLTRTMIRQTPKFSNASRNFSINAFRQNLSAQIFERTALVKDPAPADYGRLFRRAIGGAKIYFPFYAVFLGWVFGVEALCDGHL